MQTLKLLAVGTAFEDFSKNTLDHTEQLVKHGLVVGETKKLFDRSLDEFKDIYMESDPCISNSSSIDQKCEAVKDGLRVPWLKFHFPIGFDRLESRAHLTAADIETEAKERLNQLIQQHPQLAMIESNPQQYNRLLETIKQDQDVQKTPYKARTFTDNKLEGTPSWIVFDQHKHILDRWTGHRPEQEVIHLIQKLIK